MKTAVLYYSLTGNTADTARKIADNLGAKLIPLTPKKAYPASGFKKFFWGGKSAVMEEAPDLEPYAFRAEDYDCVIFGTPVWAGTMAPPLRTALRQQRQALQGKTVAAFACSGGGSAGKTFEKMKNEAGVSAFHAELHLIDPKDRHSEENARKIARFCQQLTGGEQQ